MSLELTSLKEEIMMYRVEGEPNKKVFRRLYRDMTIRSYKWRLEVFIIDYSIQFPNENKEIVLESKNYTKDTLWRKFKDWRESFPHSIELEKVEQFFFTKGEIVV